MLFSLEYALMYISVEGGGKVDLAHAMKVYGRNRGMTVSLTLTPDGGEWSASCPGHFYPQE